MKDAFGGTFILNIMLIFFVVFICFMTVAINFAKTYRIKNNVINIIERSDMSKYDNVEAEIDEYLRGIGYSYPRDRYVKVAENCDAQKQGQTNMGLTDHGVCVVPIENGTYYKVTAYIVIDFPLFNIGMVIPISGETKIMDEFIGLT